MNSLWSGMLAVVLMLFPLAPACAQQRAPLHFAVAGGWSRDAAGNFEGSRNGAHVALMLDRTGERFGVRTEAFYSRFRPERESFVCIADGATSIVSPCPDITNRNEIAALSLAGTAGMSVGRTRFYAIGGAGAYRFTRREEIKLFNACPECLSGVGATTVIGVTTNEHTSANFGVNGGLGAAYDASMIGVFLEARYHHLVGGGRDRAFVPISFGLRF